MTLKGTSAFTVKRQLVNFLKSNLTNIDVTYSQPGKFAGRSGVYIGHTRGATEIASMRAGPKARNEVYSVDIHVWAMDQNAIDSDTALEGIQQNIEAALASDTLLGLTDGTIEFAIQTSWEIDEPIPFDTPGMYFSQSKLTVEITARNL